MTTIARNARAFALGLWLLAPASAAVAATAPVCSPRMEQGWIRAAPPGATVLSGYGILRNDCPGAVVLTGVSGRDFMMAMVHETKVDNGISTMRHVKRSPLPARALLRFEPNSSHLMLMHPRRALPPGTVVKLELQLDDGRKIPAEFTVSREAPAKK